MSSVRDAIVAYQQTNVNDKTLVYPSTLNYGDSSGGTPRIRFILSPAVNSTESNKISIELPLPTELQDAVLIQTNKFSAGIMGYMVSGEGINDAAVKFLADHPDVAPVNAMYYAAASMAGTIDQNKKNTIERAIGYTQNPFYQVAFEGSVLKYFNLNWIFHPRSLSESKTIMEILKELKRSSLPGLLPSDPTRMFLSYPRTVSVELVDFDTDGFMFYKDCIIEGVTTDFFQQGPAITVDNRPASIQMSLNLREMYIQTREDIK